MQQNKAFTSTLMASATPFYPRQATSLSNPTPQELPVSGASLEATNNYTQLSSGMPYTPSFFTHVAYGSSSSHPHHLTMQTGQGQVLGNFQNSVHPSFAPVQSNFLHHANPAMMMVPVQAYYPAQEFDYFVVIDFEATCDKDISLSPQEIIEFPSVLVNSATGQLEDCFQTYVRPTHHPLLTDFCKELTGIQQIQVDNGVLLSEAISMHDKWLEVQGIKNKSFAVVTWSDWDCRVMLESECKFKGFEKPNYFDRWINLRMPFNQRFGGTRCNLQKAVELAGLTWEGRAHCGLDDARNTARLLVLLMQQGTKFSITNSLMPPDQNQQAQSPTEPSADVAAAGERRCFCGATSNKCIVRKAGPNLGRSFFGCGNWTPTTRAACSYFVWASP